MFKLLNEILGEPMKTETELPKPIAKDRTLLTNVDIKALAELMNLNLYHGPWLAGGSVRKLKFGLDIGDSDWDFFFKSEFQYNKAIKIAKDYNLQTIFESEHAITYRLGFETIQFIKRQFYNGVHDLLNDFDFSICQFATDGYDYVTGEHSIDDHKKQVLRMNDIGIRRGMISRIIKYRIYGFYINDDLEQFIADNMKNPSIHETYDHYEF
jgi:hypothetical protein